MVDDLEVTTTGELLELDQCEVGLNPCGVTIHDQTDGTGGRDHSGLRVTETMCLTQFNGLIPGGFRQGRQISVGAVGMVQWNGFDIELFVTIGVAVGRVAVVAHDAGHVLGIFRVAGEWAQLTGDFSRRRIGHTGHHSAECAAQRAALITVVAVPHVH